MQAKSIFKSKTIRFNALTILVVVATYFGYTPNAELAETVSGLLIAMTPIVNIVLRMVTKQPVTLK